MRAAATVLGLCLLSTGSQAAFVVSTAPTANVTCDGGICRASAADAVLNVHELRALFAAGDVTLVSGSEAADIVIATHFHTKARHGLVLEAWRGITIAEAVEAAPRSTVIMKTNDGGTGGNLTFSAAGRLDFAVTDQLLMINGKRYTLIDGIDALADAIEQKPAAHLALIKDVDASVKTYNHAVVRNDFRGTFEGLGHTIDKLTILTTSAQSGVGLFRTIAAAGTVRNLHLTVPSVTSPQLSEDFCVGALAGASAGKVRNVDVAGGTISTANSQIYPRECIGGLVGLNTGSIDHAQVRQAILKVAGHGGGLVSINRGSIVSSSAAQIDARGYSNGAVGGLAYSNEGTISLSWVTGTVDAGYSNQNGGVGAGGFVKVNSGTIDNAWTSALVKGGTGQESGTHTAYASAGGFVSLNSGAGTIRHAYALGDVLSYELGSVAGFALVNNGSAVIDQTYTLAKVGCGDSHCFSREAFIDGGCPDGTADYWDTSNFAGHYDCAGLAGLTDSELKAHLPAGFDAAVWGQDASINDGYPYLLANPPQ